MKCPYCGTETIKARKTDVFDFDTGKSIGTVHVTAENLPYEECAECRMSFSGPAAAARRSDAILRAVLDALDKPPSLAARIVAATKEWDLWVANKSTRSVGNWTQRDTNTMQRVFFHDKRQRVFVVSFKPGWTEADYSFVED